MRNSCEGLGIIDGSSLDETAIIPIETLGIPALLALVSEKSTNFLASSSFRCQGFITCLIQQKPPWEMDS